MINPLVKNTYYNKYLKIGIAANFDKMYFYPIYLKRYHLTNQIKNMKSTITTFLLVLSGMLSWANPNDNLYKAIIKNDLAGVKKAIAGGADVNQFDKNGNTPLCTAVFSTDIMNELIDAKADVNKFDAAKRINPLIAAADWGMVDAIKLLLDKGADINAKEHNQGCNALFHAAAIGTSAPAMQLLIDKGIDAKALNDFNMNALMYLARNGRSPQARVEQLQGQVPYLVKAGIVLPEKVQTPKTSDWSSLDERIDILLKAGIGIDDELPLILPTTTPGAEKINKDAQKCGLQQWALYHAMYNLFCRGDVARALLRRGADAKKKFGEGKINYTLLHVLAPASLSKTTQVEDVVDLLIKAGINLNTKDVVGLTPVMRAAILGNKDEVTALIKNGADLNMTQRKATIDLYPDLYGYDRVTTITWRTARDWAVETSNDDIAKILEAAGGKSAKEIMK